MALFRRSPGLEGVMRSGMAFLCSAVGTWEQSRTLMGKCSPTMPSGEGQPSWFAVNMGSWGGQLGSQLGVAQQSPWPENNNGFC